MAVVDDSDGRHGGGCRSDRDRLVRPGSSDNDGMVGN